MKHRVLLWLFAAIVGAQNISVVDPTQSWTVTVPEPPLPRVSAGQSYFSFFGHKVTRMTDARSGENGGSFRHFYSDRSALSKNSTYLTMTGEGGATFIQTLKNGMPLGRPQGIYNYPTSGPVNIDSAIWSPADDEILYVIGDYVTLWQYNARTSRWKVVRSFEKELSKGLPKGYLKIYYVSKDATRFLFDYSVQSKISHAVLAYEAPNNVRLYKGRGMAKRMPDPQAPVNFAGLGPPDRSGQWVLVQENRDPADYARDPISKVSTVTYRVNWKDNLLGEGTSVAGVYSTEHSAGLTNGNVRLASHEEQLLVDNVDPLMILRRAFLDKDPDPNDQFRLPFYDIFYWPFSYKQNGAHVSSGGPNDDWVILSLYQEGGCAERAIKPLANEILAVSTKAKAEFDFQKHAVKSNGTIRRLAHHYSYPEDCAKPVPYWGTPRASYSMDGKYVVFTSTFGRTGRTDVFLLTLPPLS